MHVSALGTKQRYVEPPFGADPSRFVSYPTNARCRREGVIGHVAGQVPLATISAVRPSRREGQLLGQAPAEPRLLGALYEANIPGGHPQHPRQRPRASAPYRTSALVQLDIPPAPRATAAINQVQAGARGA